MFWRIIVIILLLFVSTIVFFNSRNVTFFQKAQVSNVLLLDESERKLKSLTLEQKIGQLFIIGFEGKVFNSEIENLIKELHPGGILLLKRNIEDSDQLEVLINALQKTALEDTGLPLFIAGDQEGGSVSRIGWIEKTPQSKIKNPNQAYQIGQTRGKELEELGVNLNLAPLLDITLPGDFIFERSFKKNKEEIGELGEALIRGQKEGGIFVGVKHFPGYGGIYFNPEEKLAKLEKIPEISQFQKAVQAMPEMIMVSNVIYKNLNKRLPFSFLPEGNDFLKQKIKGNYLIISDDLDQNSLLNQFSLKEIITLPFNAGVDILIFSGWRLPSDQGLYAFRKAVEENEVSLERINQSVLKIIELKSRIKSYNEI